MATHLLEPAIIDTILGNQDRVHRGLHIVIDTPGTCPTQEAKCFVVGIEHHLQRLSGIGPNEQNPAVAQANMRHLHCCGCAINQNNFMAPVELTGFAGIEAQRHIGRGRGFPDCLRPTGRIAPHRIVAAVITPVAQILINPDQRQALALRVPGILRQHLIQIGPPWIDLWTRLRGPVIAELCRTGSHHLAHRVSRYPQLPADQFDRLALNLDSAVGARQNSGKLLMLKQ